jgi:hypothetical protein
LGVLKRGFVKVKKVAIEDTLDHGLPEPYSRELYLLKCSVVFEHMYESYSEKDAMVYAEVGRAALSHAS